MTATVQPTTVPSTAPSSADEPRLATLPASRRRLIRAAAIGSAAVATSAVWAVADALGANFRLSDSQGSVVISLSIVIGFTVVCAALGWIVLAGLERFSRRATSIWTGLAVSVLVLSFVPIFLEHATVGTRAALVLIHLAVAVVLIPVLRHTSK
jgi:hypothetical protein